MTETEELSGDTMALVAKAARESDKLSQGDSLDSILSHLARSYLVANKHGTDELAAELEEYSDTQAEAERKRAELHEKRRESRATGSGRQSDERIAELRERAEQASQAEGVRHNGEGLTGGEYLTLRDRAREFVGLDSPNSE